MRALRDLLVASPSTTATTERLFNCTDETRLKPEARV